MHIKYLPKPETGSMIDLIAPCMDEYLYIIDLNNDTLRISQSAVERFMLPDKFMNDATRNPAIARAFAYMKIIEKCLMLILHYRRCILQMMVIQRCSILKMRQLRSHHLRMSRKL